MAQNGPQTHVSVNRTQVCRHSFLARGVPLFFATVVPPALPALQAVAAVRGPLKKRPVARTGRFQYRALGQWPLWPRPGLAAHKRLLQERQHALGLLVGLCSCFAFKPDSDSGAITMNASVPAPCTLAYWSIPQQTQIRMATQNHTMPMMPPSPMRDQGKPSTSASHRARSLAPAPSALPRQLVPGRLVPPARGRAQLQY